MLILLSVAAYTFSLNDVSVPNRFTPSTPARSSEVNANFDTLAGRINQNNDTIEQKFIRFSDLESGDSILEKCRIDTARIDHIRSNPEADSMTISKVDINGGAIDGTVIGANSAAAGTFTTVTASGAIVGSTINTGYAASTYPSNSSTHYRDVYQYGTNTASFTGTMKFTLPKTWSNTMLTFTIKGYNYAGGQGVWQCIIGGYNYNAVDDANDAWANSSAEIRGSAPFSQVRLAHDGTKCCLLLGNTSTTWSFPQVVITEIFASHSNHTGWGEPYNMSIITSETGLTKIVTPTTSIYGNTATIPIYALIGKTTATGGYRLEVEGNQLVNGTLEADSIKSTKGINCSTINTGFGNFEIGQNLRTTDNVFFNKTTANDMTVNDTLRIGSVLGQQVKLYDGWYLEGNYLCTLSGFTSTVTCTTYYVKCGKAVTLTFSTAVGTSNTDYIHISTGLMPASIRPAREMHFKLIRWSFGGLTAADPNFQYVQSQSLGNMFQIVTFAPSGGKGINYSFSISYLTY